MSKKKDSVALFEVVQKARRGEANLNVPTWMQGQSGVEASSPAAVQAETPARAEPVPVRPMAGAAEPIVSIAGDRLRLSLSMVSCAAVVLGLLLVLTGAFGLGWWAGAPADAPDGPRGGSLRDRVAMGRHVLGGSGGPGGGAKSTGGGPTWQKGKSYLVIQSLAGEAPADYQEAQRIAAFCNANGQPAAVARYTNPRSGTKRYIVWSLTPFDAPTTRQAEQANRFALAIEALGKKYFAKHKTYDFRQRSAGKKFDPWFEEYR